MSTRRTSAERLEQHIRGQCLASNDGPSCKDILVQIINREPVEQSVIVPAVAEPLLVWILSGTAVVEERPLEGIWEANEVTGGDFFLTSSPLPYEMRWHTRGSEPFQVMHVYLGLPLLDQCAREVLGPGLGSVRFRDVSGGADSTLSLLLEQLRLELNSRHDISALFVQGIAQSLGVHLVRHYLDPHTSGNARGNALPAYRLRAVIDQMQSQLHKPFSLGQLARTAEMSEYHFSRLFKQATSLSPSQYFIRLRMTHARQLLVESGRSVIDIGLEVGYSSPGHFSQIFRREVGVTPSQYRK